MYRISRAFLAILIVFLGLSWVVWSRQVSGPVGASSLRESDANELADLKSDAAKLQTLLNQMQANFALVGNPTSPANHELQLNMEMWRVVIDQMQRRLKRMEETESLPSRSSTPRK